MTAHSRYAEAAWVLCVPSGVAPMVAGEKCLEARVGFACSPIDAHMMLG